MKTLAVQLTQILLSLLAAVFLMGQPRTSFAQAQPVDPIVGTWVRVGDDFHGYIIEIYPVADGRFEARTLNVPIWADIDGFVIGEKKLRAIAPRGEGTYVTESLRRVEGRPEYKSGELSVIDSDRLFYTSENNSAAFGSRQKWRRVKNDDPLYAYVEFGKGWLAAGREQFEEANRAMERAATIVLKDFSDPAIRNLAADLAWALAADSRAEIRNPALAKKLLPALGNWYVGNSTAAAVYAANGDFENAVKLQRKALEQVKSSNAAIVFLENVQAKKDDFVMQFYSGVIVGGFQTQMEKQMRSYEQHRPYIE